MLSECASQNIFNLQFPQNLLAVAVATDITFKEAEQVGTVVY